MKVYINKEEFIKDYNEMTYEQLLEKYKIKKYQLVDIVKKLNLSKKVGRKKKVEIVIE